MIITTISSKNQLTLPKALLDVMGIVQGEKFFIRQEKDAIMVIPVGKSVVNELSGSIKVSKNKRGVSVEEALETISTGIAEEIMG